VPEEPVPETGIALVWEVPIVYRGQVNYLIPAPTAESAREIAERCFKGGIAGDALGNEWEEIERIGTILPVKG
jgi:hypothetical protein